jgi:hypothetical protein
MCARARSLVERALPTQYARGPLRAEMFHMLTSGAIVTCGSSTRSRQDLAPTRLDARDLPDQRTRSVAIASPRANASLK